MRTILCRAAVAAALIVLAAPTARAAVSEAEAEAEDRIIARDAYVYGLPMVHTYRVMYAYSVDKSNPQYKGPFNSALNIGRVFAPDDTAFVTTQSDTPYSFSGLDLRHQPLDGSKHSYVPHFRKDRLPPTKAF